MKIRTDFVTNSSSSSFIIAKKHLDNDQLKAIRNHWALAKKMGMIDEKWDYEWDINENEDYITGYVFMDNFDISEIFDKIGINSDTVYWDEYRINLNDAEEMEYIEAQLSKRNKKQEQDDWRDLL